MADADTYEKRLEDFRQQSLSFGRIRIPFLWEDELVLIPGRSAWTEARRRKRRAYAHRYTREARRLA
jgi:hypothetical protein